MPDPHFHGTMLRYVQKHPYALRSGRSDMPPAMIRFADLLVRHGVPNIKRPVCAVCNEAKTLPYKHASGRVCGACFVSRINLANCSRCHRRRQITTRDENGPICPLCWGNDARNLAACTVCNTYGPVAVRPKGKPICQLCYDRPRRRCADCKALRYIHSTKEGRDVCRDCYSARRRNVESNCIVRHRNTRRRSCTSCGKTRACVDYLTDRPLCVPCAGRPHRRCAGCKDARPVQAVWEGGPVCSTCYATYLDELRKCSRCLKMEQLVPTREGALCRPCLGTTGSRYLCEMSRLRQPVRSGNVRSMCPSSESRGDVVRPGRRDSHRSATCAAKSCR